MPSGSAWWRTTRAAPGSSCADRRQNHEILPRKACPKGQVFSASRAKPDGWDDLSRKGPFLAKNRPKFSLNFFTRFSGLSGPFGGKPEIWGCQFFPLLPICYQRREAGKRWELWLFAADGGVKTGSLLPNARFFATTPSRPGPAIPWAPGLTGRAIFPVSGLVLALKVIKSGHNKSISGTFASKKLEGGNDPP